MCLGVCADALTCPDHDPQSDQVVFRFSLRTDGKSKWTTPATPFKGTSLRPPFVTRGHADGKRLNQSTASRSTTNRSWTSCGFSPWVLSAIL